MEMAVELNTDEQTPPGTVHGSSEQESFRWPQKAILLQGTLEDATSGDTYEFGPNSTGSKVMVRKQAPNRPFSVISNASTPTYTWSSRTDVTRIAFVEGKTSDFVYRVPHVPQDRIMQRRLEEHREHVAQLRQEIGDLDAAVADFAREVVGELGASILSEYLDAELGGDEGLADDNAR